MRNEKNIHIQACPCGGYQLTVNFIQMHLSKAQCAELHQQMQLALRYPAHPGQDIERSVLGKKGLLN